jgi:hypothetical protein
MLRSRLPAALRPRRPTPPDVPKPFDTPSGPPPSIGALLLRSRAGRLFLASAAIKLVLGALRLTVTLPAVLDLVGTMATVGLVAAAGWFLWQLFVRLKRRLLWRVRRKLILSYIFIGVVPALLIITFFMLGAWVVATNVSAYLFRDGYDDVVAHARLAAAAAASEIGRDPSTTEATVVRVQRAASEPYPALSVAFVPSAAGGTALAAGAWRHADPPDGPLPPWVLNAAQGFAGTIARDRRTPRAGADLTVRAVAPVLDDTRRLGHVIVDVPVDAALLLTLYALPHHPVRGARDGARARAVDHRVGPRAVHRHRARPPRRLQPPIEVQSRDQLGELAESFNQMTGSIEDLLRQAEEKKRLEEELRIAREIQMSLLPRGKIAIRGSPSRAVRARARGGRRLLRLPADRRQPGGGADRRRRGEGHLGGAVHGGAEGVVLSLVRSTPSPRELMIEGEPDHLGAPRQPRVHHDDLRGPGPAGGR